MLYQDRHMTCQQYYETFTKSANMLECCGGTPGKEPGLVDAKLEAARIDWELVTEEELEAAEGAAWECVLAIALLMGSNQMWYGKLLEDLENDFMQGRDNYPLMLTQVYSLLLHWKQDTWNLMWLISAANDGMAFMNIGTEDTGCTSSGRGGVARSGQQQQCYSCNQLGHIMWDCPD